MITITITTKEMFDVYMDCMKDVIWDDSGSFDSKEFSRVVSALAVPDMAIIRQLFIEGYTMLFLGEKGSILDNRIKGGDLNEYEVRVINHRTEKLLGVVINSELIF